MVRVVGSLEALTNSRIHLSHSHIDISIVMNFVSFNECHGKLLAIDYL